jgi:hypothetical protein
MSGTLRFSAGMCLRLLGTIRPWDHKPSCDARQFPTITTLTSTFTMPKKAVQPSANWVAFQKVDKYSGCLRVCRPLTHPRYQRRPLRIRARRSAGSWRMGPLRRRNHPHLPRRPPQPLRKLLPRLQTTILLALPSRKWCSDYSPIHLPSTCEFPCPSLHAPLFS